VEGRTDWFRLVAFGEAGETLCRFGKGERVQVQGRLQSSEYTDREGLKRSSVEVVVLRSDPAPLPRKAQPASEPETPLADTVEEPVVEAEASAVSTDAPAKSRRRRKVAA
jgi:single-strand DNA-binding protein